MLSDACGTVLRRLMSPSHSRCGHAAACSSPVRGSRVSGTPAAPLRIFPLTLGTAGLIHLRQCCCSLRPSVRHPSSRLYLRLRVVQATSTSGKVTRIVQDRRTPTSAPGWSALHHRGDCHRRSAVLVSLAGGLRWVRCVPSWRWSPLNLQCFLLSPLGKVECFPLKET